MNTESVLFLTYWYPNKSSKSFGIFIKRHAHAIQLHHSIVVLSLNIKKEKVLYKKRLEVFTDEAGVETHKIWLESRFYSLLFMLLPLHYLVLKNYIQRDLKKHRFSILHSNIIFPCGIVGYRLSAKLKLRHFVTEHWTKIDRFFTRNIYRAAGKKVYDRAVAISGVSSQLLATIQKHTSNRRLLVIPNVIDPAEFYYDPLVAKDPGLTFVAVSYWSNFKNPFYFLDALKELQAEKKLPAFKLTLVGKGEQVDVIKQAGYAYPIDYKGAMNAEEINKELNKSHIFLHGSDFETFSVIIAEALMCGLPSVVSPVGIGPEVIHAGNGFVTDNTVADWKEKIMACYHTTYDNRQIAEQLKKSYTLETVGTLFSGMYQTA